MDQVTLSVSQLCCACLDPQWLKQYLAGENPSTFTPSPEGVNVHGADFHKLAEQFISWLALPANAAEALALRDEDAIVLCLRRRGADKLITRWLTENEIDTAAAFMQALFNFATRLLQLRRQRPNFASWNEVYLGQEVAIHDALVYTGEGSVFVSGAIDSLRIHPAGEMEIVDYKLSHGHELEKEVLQIAIYQHLMRLKKPEFACRGCLEYLLPTLQVQEFTAVELDRIYRERVDPIFPILTARTPRPPVIRTPPPLAPPQLTAPVIATPPTVVPKPVALPKVTSPPQPSDPPDHDPALFHLGQDVNDRYRQVGLPLAVLTQHSAIIGGSGSGKTTLAMGMVEEALLHGLSVVIVDRKGDFCRYADSVAWEDSAPDSATAARLAQLRGIFDVDLFTPGHNGGRPLGIRVIPAAQKDAEENDLACRAAAHALGGILGLSLRSSDQPKIAILTSVIRILCASFTTEEPDLGDIIVALEDPSEELRQAIGPFDPRHVRRLVEAIQTLKILRSDLLCPRRETLDASAFFSSSKRPRLTIIATKFLDQKNATQFWMTHFLLELGRLAASSASTAMRGLVLFDEAGLYLPAASRPPTKAPLENLLLRARASGLGVVLATQNPGDFDYGSRKTVLTWLVGQVREKTALERMQPLISDATPGTLESLARQRPGQFLWLQEDRVAPFVARRSVLGTAPLSEDAILKLARVPQH